MLFATQASTKSVNGSSPAPGICRMRPTTARASWERPFAFSANAKAAPVSTLSGEAAKSRSSSSIDAPGGGAGPGSRRGVDSCPRSSDPSESRRPPQRPAPQASAPRRFHPPPVPGCDAATCRSVAPASAPGLDRETGEVTTQIFGEGSGIRIPGVGILAERLEADRIEIGADAELRGAGACSSGGSSDRVGLSRERRRAAVLGGSGSSVSTAVSTALRDLVALR